jgi:hypothetical protein
MARAIAAVGAPSSIGIRPYEDGQARHLDLVGRRDAADVWYGHSALAASTDTGP